jgi:hypothetical protein
MVRNRGSGFIPWIFKIFSENRGSRGMPGSPYNNVLVLGGRAGLDLDLVISRSGWRPVLEPSIPFEHPVTRF